MVIELLVNFDHIFKSIYQLTVQISSFNRRKNKSSFATDILGVWTPNCMMPYSESYDIYDYISVCYEHGEISYYDRYQALDDDWNVKTKIGNPVQTSILHLLV